MSATESIIDLIGNTPVLKLTEFDTGPCELYLKLEQRNPGGSVCDRGANAMIRTAESDGAIAAGDTLVAATTGNNGRQSGPGDRTSRVFVDTGGPGKHRT